MFENFMRVPNAWSLMNYYELWFTILFSAVLTLLDTGTIDYINDRELHTS